MATGIERLYYRNEIPTFKVDKTKPPKLAFGNISGDNDGLASVIMLNKYLCGKIGLNEAQWIAAHTYTAIEDENGNNQNPTIFDNMSIVRVICGAQDVTLKPADWK